MNKSVKANITFSIELTWSKLVALLIIILAFIIDKRVASEGSVFMYSLPFAVALITGKQVIDWRKKAKTEDNEEEQQ
jgi:hypothetical protein